MGTLNDNNPGSTINGSLIQHYDVGISKSQVCVERQLTDRVFLFRPVWAE